MLRKGDKCWIKAVPITQESTPSTLYLPLNGKMHQWDIYDISGRDAHKVYFKGTKCVPIFYLKSSDNRYRIDCGNNDIQIVSIIETHKNDSNFKKDCICDSSQTSCWAIAIYSTCEPEKSPFDMM